MTSTASETTSTAPAPAAAAPATCPHCGSHDLYQVELHYQGTLGFRPDVHGQTPEVGDMISSCGQCAEFTIIVPDHIVVDEHHDDNPEPAPPAPGEPAPSETPAEPAVPAEPAPSEPAAPAEPAPPAPEPMPGTPAPASPDATKGGQE